jgi:PAS domain S-box-containing protein
LDLESNELLPAVHSWYPPELPSLQARLGTWVWDLRTEEVNWSPQLFTLLGYDPKRDRATTENFFAALDEETRPQMRESAARVLKTGQAELVTARVCLPDGSRREVTMDSTATFDGDGNPYLMVGTVFDHTDDLAIEAFLHRQQEHFDLAQSTAGVGSWSIDLASRKLEWSRELYRILGVPLETRPTRELFYSLVHPEDLDIVHEAERSFFRGRPHGHEYRVVRADGSLRFLYTTGVPLKNSDGEMIGLLGTSLDVTDRKQLETRVSEAVKMEALGRLAGGVAHDFNNLLTVIQGFCQLLAEREVHDELIHIQEAAEAAGRLTQRLLEFSRQSVVSIQPLDINDVVRRSTALLERIIGEDVEVVLDLADDLWPVAADAGQMEQILFNLAANSRDAMPKGGKFQIETRNLERSSALGPAVEFIVSDTGEGMPAEVAENAFEPFFTTKERSKGTGLGLSTVFGIVTQSQGDISIKSSTGAGASIKIVLPRATPLRSTPRTGKAAWGKTGPLSILVVEDDPMIATLLTRTLTAAGHQVLAATRPSTAIERFQSATDPIDLLISDVVMPEMSGPVLAKMLENLSPGLLVLFISGYPAGELELGAGDVSFLPKPFAPADVIAAVERITQGRDDDKGLPLSETAKKPPRSRSRRRESVRGGPA